MFCDEEKGETVEAEEEEEEERGDEALCCGKGKVR